MAQFNTIADALDDKFITVDRFIKLKVGDNKKLVPKETWRQPEHQYKLTNCGKMVGCATGNGLIVIDLDINHDIEEIDENGEITIVPGPDGIGNFKAFCEKNKITPPSTLTVKTPRGGLHLYYGLPAGVSVRNSASKLTEGVDIRGDGGFVYCPPTADYQIVQNRSIAECPAEFLKFCKAEKVKKTIPNKSNDDDVIIGNVTDDSEVAIAMNEAIPNASDNHRTYEYFYDKIQSAKEGTRNDTLYRCSFAVLSDAAARGIVLPVTNLRYAAIACGLAPAEIDATLASARMAAEQSPSLLSGTDLNSPSPRKNPILKKMPSGGEQKKKMWQPEKIYAQHFESQLKIDKYIRLLPDSCIAAKVPTYYWSGMGWRPDQNRLRRHIQRKLREIGEQWRSQRVSDILSLIEDSKVIDKNGDWLQRPANTCYCENGVYNLDDGLRDYNKSIDRNLNYMPVKFDATAKAPQWQEFIGQVIPADCQEWIQRYFGAILISERTERLLILVGDGANGKTVLMNVIRTLFGDAAILLSDSDIDRDAKVDRTSYKLLGRSLAIVDEMGENSTIKDSLIKSITTSERLSGRALYQEAIEFDNYCSLIMATNHLPQVRGADRGIWRRITVLPMDYHPDKKDRKLTEKLCEERSGILNWLIYGAIAYREKGLAEIPQTIKDRNEVHQIESNTVRLFLDTHCKTDDPSQWVSSSILYDVYNCFCRANGLRSKGAVNFGRDLERLKIARKRSDGTKYNVWIIGSSIEFDELLRKESIRFLDYNKF